MTFLGAIESVKGSMHLLDTGTYRILLDCGKSVGVDIASAENRRGISFSKSTSGFPFDPASIDLVLLSHAHVDHCGSLPLLVKNGFRGPIICTKPTRELIEIVLFDSARFEERDIERERHFVGGDYPIDMTYRFEFMHVDQTLDLCRGFDYGAVFCGLPGLEVRLLDSAHVLGSNLFDIEFSLQDKRHRCVFTGDIGRHELPFVGTPHPIPSADLIICESTYGGRNHEPFEKTLVTLATIVRETIAQGGKVLIPAFSLGRTNLLRCCLVEMMQRGLIPKVPLFIDSPMALEFDDIYSDLARHGNPVVDGSDVVQWIFSPEDSWHCTTSPEPSIIIASGGMCEGGRILDHLRQHIDDPRCSLILVSYQAPDSLGAQLLDKKPSVRFHGRNWNKWIRVEQIQGFSAHADQSDLSKLLSETDRASRIRLVHGEAEEKASLQKHLIQIGFTDTQIPRLFDTFRFT